MRMSRRECWVAAWKSIGIESEGNIDKEIGDRTVLFRGGAERDAVAFLLGEANRYCVAGNLEGAKERVALAAAMVEQRGRVLGALRAVKAVEEVLWPGSEGQLLSSGAYAMREHGARVAVEKAMTDNGFGPREGAK